MTGFGVARGKVGASSVVVEVRSVNHRYCEVNFRIPGKLASLEPEISRRIRKKFARGKIDLFLREESVSKEEEEILLAKKAYASLQRLQKVLNIPGEITLSDFLTFRYHFLSSSGHPQGKPTGEGDLRPLWDLIESALEGLESMREGEGARLQKWFFQRMKKLHRLLKSIEGHGLRKTKDYKARLKKKFDGVVPLEDQRLTQEAALMADRTDVTEEVVRLKSHLKELEKFVGEKGAVGRKLDFLVQEMGREINTIGSKSQGIRISHDVIEFKSELERVREQIQNIE